MSARKKDERAPRRTKSAKRAAARHGLTSSRKPAPALRTASSLREALALLVVLLTVAGAVFLFQGSPDLWDLWHARVKYGVRWSGVGCG